MLAHVEHKQVQHLYELKHSFVNAWKRDEMLEIERMFG